MLRKLLELLGFGPTKGHCRECRVVTAEYAQMGMGSELGFWKCFICKTCQEKKHKPKSERTNDAIRQTAS